MTAPGAAYQAWLAQGAVDVYLDSLACEGLGWWYDMDIPRLAAHLMPLQLPAFADVALPPRIRLLAAVTQPVIDVEAVRALGEGLQADGDHEAASVAAGAGVAAVWDSGRHFHDYGPWYDNITTMLAEGDLPPHAQASLFGFKGLVELTGQGAIEAASESYARQRALAERAGSNSLLVFAAAADSYCHFYTGKLDTGELLLADACALAAAGGVSHVAHVYLVSCMGLYDTVQGRAQRACTYLDSLTSQAWYDLLPPSVWVSGLGHLLTALSWRGPSDALEAVARRLRQHVIPEHHAFYHCYSHYNLGVVALQGGQAHRALQHAQIALEYSRASESPLNTMVPALLRIQALADLQRDDEALEYLDAWDADWGASAFRTFAAICALERAHLLARRSAIDEAKASLQRAGALMPPGVEIPQIGRDEEFVRRLQARLVSDAEAPAHGPSPGAVRPVVIGMLGGLRVEVGDKVIHDRKWRGGRTKALLKAVVVHGGKKLSLAQLADLLWPDAEGDQAYRNLKVLVWRLRRLGLDKGEQPAPWLQIHHGHLSLAEAYCAVDVLDFEAGLHHALHRSPPDWAALRQALQGYTGDFLPGDDSETWITEHRERLRRRFVEAVLVLADTAADAASREASVPWLQRALEIDELDERLYQRLMQLYLQLGYPAKALEAYHTAQAALEKGLAIPPGPVLVDLARQAGGDHR